MRLIDADAFVEFLKPPIPGRDTSKRNMSIDDVVYLINRFTTIDAMPMDDAFMMVREMCRAYDKWKHKNTVEGES